ncbi:hypothetical protein [Ktedonobacter robiniae]|nr:hypothetical protein [Ktedonobacter robiniae]
MRAAFVDTLLSANQEIPIEHLSSPEHIRMRVKAIHARLSEIVATLRET